MEKRPSSKLTYHPPTYKTKAYEAPFMSLSEAFGRSNPTTAVNATSLHHLGMSLGLETIYYGPQHYLESPLNNPPYKLATTIQDTENSADLILFRFSPLNRFNVLIQTKETVKSQWIYEALPEPLSYSPGFPDFDQIGRAHV